MNKSITAARKRDVASALGSVRAEGLAPSKKTVSRLNDYANGKLSVQDLRKITLIDIRNSHNQK